MSTPMEEETTPVIVTPVSIAPEVVTPVIVTPVSVEGLPAEPYVVQSEPVPPAPEHTWIEEIEIAGSQLVERVKDLIAEGKVRRLIIRNAEDKVLVEIPLTAGVAVGGVVTFFAPVLAALGALAGLLTRVKVQIVRGDG